MQAEQAQSATWRCAGPNAPQSLWGQARDPTVGLGKVPKNLAGDPVPDLEDVLDVSISWMSIAPHQHIHLFQLDDEVVDVSDDERKKVKDEDEIAADKLIQASKPQVSEG